VQRDVRRDHGVERNSMGGRKGLPAMGWVMKGQAAVLRRVWCKGYGARGTPAFWPQPVDLVNSRMAVVPSLARV